MPSLKFFALLYIYCINIIRCDSCPEKAVLNSCVCDQNVITCNGTLKSVRQLFEQISAHSESKFYDTFILANNTDISEIEDNAFCGIGFRHIYIDNVENLSKLSALSFNTIANTVESLYITGKTLLGSKADYVAQLFAALHSLISVRKIFLTVNEIKVIPFSGVKQNQLNLTEFYMRFNHRNSSVDTVENFAFYYYRNIEKIDLENAQIDNIPEYAFQIQGSSTKVLEINLSRNNLNANSFALRAFANNGRPMLLDLSHNNINYLDEQIIAPILFKNKNNSIVLTGNQLECDCRMQWILKLKQLFNQTNFINASCFNLNNKSIYDLNDIDFVDCGRIWVSPNGDDNNPGTRDKPLLSVEIAQRRVREMLRLNYSSAANGVRVILRDGVYRLNRPLFFRHEDSGKETKPTIIEAAENERPVISGGIVVTGWRKLDEDIIGLPLIARDKVWVANTPEFNGRTVQFRHLWVNDVKAVRARHPNNNSELFRLINFDNKNKELCILSSILNSLKKLSGVEIVLLRQWTIAILRAKSTRFVGDRAFVKLQEPENSIAFAHPWPQLNLNPENMPPFFVTNAIEFLDQPGEWFQEWPSGRVFYWPREGEQLTQAEVTIPALETIVQVFGGQNRNVEHIHFKNISFQHSNWLTPSLEGHTPLQTGMSFIDAYRLNIPGTPEKPGLDNQAWLNRANAAVIVKRANNIRFENCRFEHLGASGLDFFTTTHDNQVIGSVFRDIGGNGIQVGSFMDDIYEAHLAYNPLADSVCSNTTISNNLITECTNEDWGTVGIAVGYARNVTVSHNEVSYLSYTGVSLGWGWTDVDNIMRSNTVYANHIHHIALRLADTGGIYTLSSQPETFITENSVHDIQPPNWSHDPKHWSYLYLDQGSAFITVINNWCPQEIFQLNHVFNNRFELNGPNVSQAIKDAAGLQPAYRYLLNG